ncbi:hypothetical protein SBRCBS47491_005889 [Sporothrix bragantina]|uniref:Uncharacterized protein n=1 Tax=Sporothrix bragantina TaxID=671064 RepID=A0ABP0C1A3_9PEZI
MAAEPPPCPHYYDGFNIAHGGNEPSAEFMTDRGLWTATKESRWQIQNEYRKAAERLAGGNTHFCYEYRTGENVRMHRRLGYLNKTVVTFFEQLHSLPREIKMLRQLAADNLRELVMDLANDIKANEVHSDFAPTWEDGEVRPTTAELQEVCQALADEYLT